MRILIIVLVIISLLSIWIYFTKDEENFYSLLLSLFSVLAILAAGIFTYFKYEDSKKESNYQKVLSRYVDNIIDPTNKEMSHYVMSVILAVRVDQDERYSRASEEQRISAYLSSVKNMEALTASFMKLNIFDSAVQLSFIQVLNQAKVVMHQLVEDAENPSAIEQKLNFLELMYRFISINLQGISELIIRESDIYDVPNIENIKKHKDFKVIIDQYKKFSALYEQVIHNSDESKKIELLEFIVAYSNERGLPVKLEITKSGSAKKCPEK